MSLFNNFELTIRNYEMVRYKATDNPFEGNTIFDPNNTCMERQKLQFLNRLFCYLKIVKAEI